MTRTACFETLGCRLNQADTALMTGCLNAAGITVEPSPSPETDIIIVNTCGVTASAVRKSKQAFRKIRKNYPNACLVVTGCGVNIETESWRAESGADLVLVASERPNIVVHLQKFYDTHTSPTQNFPQHTPYHIAPHAEFKEGSQSVYPFKSRAFLKIQDGCNNFCTYCIVPYARGPERSRNLSEIFDDFHAIRTAGHEEIILTGVNTATFQSPEGGLYELLLRLIQEPGNFRIRLSSAEPHPEIYKFIDLMAKYPEKICRFLHLPAQHLSDAVLHAMNRKYTVEEYLKYIDYAREKVPDIHLGTDLIVGFPTETEDDFQTMLDWTRKIHYSNIHVFPFSPRHGTVAATMHPCHTSTEVHTRTEQLLAIAQKTRQDFAKRQEGKNCSVVVENVREDGTGVGWSDHYIRATVPAHLQPKPHRLYRCTLQGVMNDDSTYGI